MEVNFHSAAVKYISLLLIAVLTSLKFSLTLGVNSKSSDFATQYIRKTDLHSVTEGQGMYRVYPCEGSVSEIIPSSC